MWKFWEIITKVTNQRTRIARMAGYHVPRTRLKNGCTKWAENVTSKTARIENPRIRCAIVPFYSCTLNSSATLFSLAMMWKVELYFDKFVLRFPPHFSCLWFRPGITGLSYWIGYTQVFGGIWRWDATGTAGSYQKWDIGEPDNEGGCARMTPYIQGVWRDWQCSKELPFMCKKFAGNEIG